MQIDDIYEIFDSAERKWLVDNCDAVRAMMKRPEQPVGLSKRLAEAIADAEQEWELQESGERDAELKQKCPEYSETGRQAYLDERYCLKLTSVMLLAKELLRAPEREIVEESGWVIELAASETCNPQYWCGSSLWMTEHLKALRFARKQDAQQAVDFMLDGINIRICEHSWG